MSIKYPEVHVVLTDTDGNAFAIVGKVMEALRIHGVPEPVVLRFRDEALSKDYNHLVHTCMRWVTVH